MSWMMAELVIYDKINCLVFLWDTYARTLLPEPAMEPEDC